MSAFESFAESVLARAVKMGHKGSDNRLTATCPTREPSDWHYTSGTDDPPDERRAALVRESADGFVSFAWWDTNDEFAASFDVVCEAFDIKRREVCILRQPVHRSSPKLLPAQMDPRGAPMVSSAAFPDLSAAEFGGWDLDRFAASTAHYIENLGRHAFRKEIANISGIAYISRDRTRRVQRQLRTLGPQTLIASRDFIAPNRADTLAALRKDIEEDPNGGAPVLQGSWWSNPGGRIEAVFGDTATREAKGWMWSVRRKGLFATLTAGDNEINVTEHGRRLEWSF